MSGDPLDRRREMLVGALNDSRPSPDWAWDVLNTWDDLVEVARAARAFHDQAWKPGNTSIEAYNLRVALAQLAALDQKAGTA